MISAPSSIAAVVLRPAGPAATPVARGEAKAEPAGPASSPASGPPRPLVDIAGVAAVQGDGPTAVEGAQDDAGAATDTNARALDPDDEREVERLKREDARVRAHESAHARTGGPFAGPPSFEFSVGPDGNRYAVAGSVAIDTQPVAGDPAGTVRKMEIVKRAALAPADPSGQDRAVAAEAERGLMEARAELTAERSSERAEAGSNRPDEAGGEPDRAGGAGGGSASSTDAREPGAGSAAAPAVFAAAAGAYRNVSAVSAPVSRLERSL